MFSTRPVIYWVRASHSFKVAEMFYETSMKFPRNCPPCGFIQSQSCFLWHSDTVIHLILLSATHHTAKIDATTLLGEGRSHHVTASPRESLRGQYLVHSCSCSSWILNAVDTQSHLSCSPSAPQSVSEDIRYLFRTSARWTAIIRNSYWTKINEYSYTVRELASTGPVYHCLFPHSPSSTYCTAPNQDLILDDGSHHLFNPGDFLFVILEEYDLFWICSPLLTATLFFLNSRHISYPLEHLERCWCWCRTSQSSFM